MVKVVCLYFLIIKLIFTDMLITIMPKSKILIARVLRKSQNQKLLKIFLANKRLSKKKTRERCVVLSRNLKRMEKPPSN